ncbi:hypothetical protein Tco_1141162 [Tanacetum coccineum]
MLRGTQPTVIQSAILRAEIQTDEAVSYGTLRKGNAKRKGVEETNKQRGWGNDNKGRKNYHIPIKHVAPINAVRGEHEPGTCYECGSRVHFRNTCRKLTRAPGQVGNRVTIKENRNTRNNRNQVKGRAFNVNAVGALQDPNVVTSNEYIINGQKTKQNKQNRAREWKEHEKSKPKNSYWLDMRGIDQKAQIKGSKVCYDWKAWIEE